MYEERGVSVVINLLVLFLFLMEEIIKFILKLCFSIILYEILWCRIKDCKVLIFFNVEWVLKVSFIVFCISVCSL